jgi:TM2 domain-containing membrane protein YozV
MRCCLVLYLFSIVLLFKGNEMHGCNGQRLSADKSKHDEQAELAFIKYLISRGDFGEALFLLNDFHVSTSAQADSVCYLKGWTLYQQRSLLSSAGYFLKVSEESHLYPKSRFFGAYNLAHSGKYMQAKQTVGQFNSNYQGMYEAMAGFQLSGIALLERDLSAFSELSGNYSGRYNAFAAQEQYMMQHFNVLVHRPTRSPVIAGMLSAFVPGLGKIYAGKKGEGIAGFLYTLALGATAYDFYRGSGAKSALFIVSGSIASIFYIGNIWGSVTAVHRNNREFNYEMDQRILFDMHIPLRNAFNW